MPRQCSTTPDISSSVSAHHVVVVGVGLVELEHGELRIVGPVHALVPEVVADLVDPLEPAHQQPLEVQLVRDAQVQRHVQRVVVGDERPRRGAAVQRLQDRRLDLEEAALVEEAPDPAQWPWRAARKTSRTSGMHREVGVALAVAELGVGQPAEGDGAFRPVAWVLPRGSGRSDLASRRDLGGPHGDLAALGAEQPARDADVIVEIEKIDHLVPLAQLVLAEVDLDPAAGILEVAEHRLALGAPATRSGPAMRRPRAVLAHLVAVGSQRLGRGVGALVPVGERRDRPAPPARPASPAGRPRRSERSSTVLTPPCLRTASGTPG